MRKFIAIGLLPQLIHAFPSHNHPCWEIVYYTHGSGVVKVGDEKITFQSGDIICLPPDIPHSEDSPPGFRNIFLSVNTPEFARNINKALKFRDNDSHDYLNILNQLHKEYHMKRKNWAGITEALLNVLDEYMLSWGEEKIKNPMVEKLENMLISNISNKNIRIDRLMEEFPLSKDHFRKLFIKETGKAPLEYLTEKRINYAKHLLESRYSSAMMVKEVAALVGYDDPYYFSRVFKRSTGKSPTEWSNLNGI